MGRLVCVILVDYKSLVSLSMNWVGKGVLMINFVCVNKFGLKIKSSVFFFVEVVSCF